jgi:hypothetical protein
MGAFFAVGFAATQANAGVGQGDCNLEIEINALRGGSPTVIAGATKDITAKARIKKGSALAGTTILVNLTIQACDAEGCWQTLGSDKNMITLGVGKGGQGDKIRMDVDRCNDPGVEFIATFEGQDPDGAGNCEASKTLTKTCK